MLTNRRSSCLQLWLKGTCLLLCLSLKICVGMKIDHYMFQEDDQLIRSTFDVDTVNKKVIVGTTNQLFHLDLDLSGASKTNEMNLIPTEEAHFQCVFRDRFPPMRCQNFHRLVLGGTGEGNITNEDGVVFYIKDLVLTCSTNAYDPKCHYRKRTNLLSVMEVSGSKFIPYGPDGLPIAMWSDGGDRLISTSSLDYLYSDYGLVISEAPFNGEIEVQTRPGQRTWFNNNPTFVSMHAIGNYYYVFFKEEAIESGTKVIYSRVSRVCKNDTGFPINSKSIFYTFVKATIRCSVVDPADDSSIPYHYNNMQDSYYDRSRNMLYAIFTSAISGPRGSVLCSYNFGIKENDLDGVFSGTFVLLQHSMIQETSVTGDFMCSRTERNALDYQLVNNVVVPCASQPLLQVDGYAVWKILPIITINNYDVLFATASRRTVDDLYLLKFTKPLSSKRFTLIEETFLPGNLNVSSVNKMMIYGTGATAYVYIGTESGIYRVPVQSCSNYTSCCSCVEARDPYCAFNQASLSCSPTGQSGDFNTSIQDLVNGDANVCRHVVVVDATMGQSTSTNELLNPVDQGLNSSTMFTDNTWIITGTVVGFVVGIILGVVIMAMFRRWFGRKGGVRCSSSSSCELADGGRNNFDVTIAPSKLHRVITNATDSDMLPKGGNLRMNNTTSEFLSSFTRSSENDYSSPPDACTSKIPPNSPVKEYPSSPVKTDMCEESDTLRVSKCSETPTPSPTPPPTLSKTSPPPTSGYRAQGAIFKFDPTSIKMNSPTASSFTTRNFTGSVEVPPTQKVEGASARRGTDPNLGSGTSASRCGTDPNLKMNYRQNVHITNQQRQNYGRNILARYPSIDGSKSKYLPNGEERARKVPPPVFPKPTLPPPQETVVQLDAEVGSSQC